MVLTADGVTVRGGKGGLLFFVAGPDGAEITAVDSATELVRLRRWCGATAPEPLVVSCRNGRELTARCHGEHRLIALAGAAGLRLDRWGLARLRLIIPSPAGERALGELRASLASLPRDSRLASRVRAAVVRHLERHGVAGFTIVAGRQEAVLASGGLQLGVVAGDWSVRLGGLLLAGGDSPSAARGAALLAGVLPPEAAQAE